MTAVGLMALAMAGVFSGFLLQAAVPAAPRWAPFAATLAPAAVWFLGISIRREAGTAVGWRRGDRLERAGATAGVLVFAAVLAGTRGVGLNHGEGFARAMATGGLVLSAALALVSVYRRRLFGTSLEEEGLVLAGRAPPWRRGWAAARIAGEWTFVTLIGATFTAAGVLLAAHPARAGTPGWEPYALVVFFGATAVTGALMIRQRLRALVPPSGPPRASPPRRAAFLRRYRVDGDGLVEYRRGVEVHFPWDAIQGVALGEWAQHMAVFVRVDAERAVRAARPAQGERWTRRRLKEAARTRAWAGADLVVMAFQCDLPLAELKERVARGMGIARAR